MVDDESKIAEKYEALCGVMDEQMRRLWAATEARALGYGGVSTVARAVGLTRPTITAGMKELGDARELVAIAPKQGFFPASPRTQARETRSPVKEPGPMTAAKSLTFAGTRFSSLKSPSIAGRSR